MFARQSLRHLRRIPTRVVRVPAAVSQYHGTPFRWADDDAEDKKKLLKEKAKEAAAAAETKQEEEAPKAESKEAKAPAASTETEKPAKATTTPEASSKTDSPEYSSSDLTTDAAKHKAGLEDSNVPPYQNPLHHENPELKKTYPEDFESKEAFEASKVPLPPLDMEGSIPAPPYLHDIADEIVNLTMLEMNELVNKIADHYGFNEAQLSPDGVQEEADDDDAEAAAPVAEKTQFDIKLVGFDEKAKIKVIKEIRSIAGLGLKEAKELVESAPKVVLKDIKKETAEEIKAKLEEIGAQVEIV